MVTLASPSEAALVAFLALPHPQHQPLPHHSHSHAILGIAPVPWTSVCVLLPGFCLRTFGRCSSKACPLSYMLINVAHLVVTTYYALL